MNLELQEKCEKKVKNTLKDDNLTFVNVDNNITNNNIKYKYDDGLYERSKTKYDIK